MKILIVDDMVENLYMLESLLKGSGYEVVSAKNGVEALERLKTGSIDMIISDILMPKMDGYQLCRECKRDDTLRKIPFIFYTATYTEKRDEEFAMSLGAERFIVKGKEPELFMETIKGVIKEYEKGILTPSKITVEKKDAAYLLVHNERLRNKLEQKLVQLEEINSVLRAIRGVNQLIIREKDRDILLQKTCDVMIEARGYDASWLGFLSDEKTFARVVGSGLGEYVSLLSEHVMDGDHPPCIKNALVQKDIVVIVNKPRDCGDCFFKSAYVGKEAAIIRVERADRLFGLLVILFAPDVPVGEEEKGLLKEIAGDIALAIHNMELEEESKQSEEELLNSEKRLRYLSSQLITAQERERRRISLELHDEMGQTLTAININLRSIEKELPLDLAPLIKEKIAETYSLTDQASEQIRELSHYLRPSMLDDLGLVPTLRWYLDVYRKRTNLDVKYEPINFEERPSPDVETVIYRVVQEALNNIVKHAQASKVLLRLERKEKEAAVFIKDNGRGFEVNEVLAPDDLKGGIGILGMQERVSILGGKFSIQSSKGHGTRISAEIPLH